MTRRPLCALAAAVLAAALLTGAVPVPGAAPTAAPAIVEDALGAVPADDPRMEAYSHGGYLLFALGSLWSIGVLALIVFSGFAVRLQGIARRVARGPNLEVAIYVVLLGAVTFAASFPLRVYRSYVREKAYGFANQTFAAWLGDQGKGLLVSIVLQAIFFTLLYVAIRRLGRAWWVAGGVLGVLFLVLGMAVAPVYIDPLFNTFEPLKDKTLRGEILDLARAQGIPAGEVYQVDASRQSEHNNAYVTGLLGSQRIVLYDTILRRFAPREIRFIMGHEMGHYVLHHVWKFIALLSVVIFVALYLVDRMARSVIARRPPLGIAALAEPASLPLMILIASVFLLVVSPVLATASRAQEHQADVFGLEVVKDPLAAASSFIKFGRYDLSEYEVNPLIEALMYSHPSPANRIRFAQEYAHANGAGASAEAAAPDGARARGPRTVAFLVVDGVYNSELVAPYDVLQHVRFHSPGDWPETFTVSPDGRPVRTFEGLRLNPDHSFANSRPIDVLVVPSAEHSMDSDLENRALIEWVRATGTKARHVVSLCDGAFVLAKAGLLDGVQATTFPADQDRFGRMFPKVDLVREVSFVDAGRALTSVGGAKSYDVALWLVERLYGAEAARGIGKGLVIDWDAASVRHRVAPAAAGYLVVPR